MCAVQVIWAFLALADIAQPCVALCMRTVDTVNWPRVHYGKPAVTLVTAAALLAMGHSSLDLEHK